MRYATFHAKVIADVQNISVVFNLSNQCIPDICSLNIKVRDGIQHLQSKEVKGSIFGKCPNDAILLPSDLFHPRTHGKTM